MKQISLAQTGCELSIKRTRKREFLDEMDVVIPWAALLGLLRRHAPENRMGRPPFALETMLRIHLLQQFFGLSDPAMEEALHYVPLYREFARLDAGMSRMPDESTILRFRHFLEAHQLGAALLATVNAELSRKGLLLRQGTVVDATLIAAPCSTKNQSGERDPDMHQTQKGNQWHFCMTSPPQAGAGRCAATVLSKAKDAAQPHKAHIGADADSGLVHTVTTTAANAHDVTQAAALLHGQESDVFADSGYRGVDKREEVQAQHPDVNWHVAMMPSKRRLLDSERLADRLAEQLEQVKARIRAKVEHPFRVIKQQFGYVKTRYRGLEKNTQQILVLFALSNLWMVRKREAMHQA